MSRLHIKLKLQYLVLASAQLIALVAVATSPVHATGQGQAIVNAAASQSGVPYCGDGGSTTGPTHGTGGPGCGAGVLGFDCSGLALFAVYQATGINLPHGSGMQSAPGGQVIAEANLQPGDLVFFGGGSLSNFEHVGVYAGSRMMWDANDYNVPVQQHSLDWEESALAFDGGVRYWSTGGTLSWVPISGDWDGNGTVTIGSYDPNTATFYLRNSSTTGVSDIAFRYGNPDWVPITGDWTGSGKTSVGVYDPSTARFYLRTDTSSVENTISFIYGNGGSWKPITGDWIGSGKTSVGVYNPTTATFYLRSDTSSVENTIAATQYGSGGNWIPITGDWDGNGTTTIGVYNPTTATYYMSNSNTSGVTNYSVQYGNGGSWVPITGDWDGNKTTTIGVYNPSTATFYLSNSNTSGVSFTSFQYGNPN